MVDRLRTFAGIRRVRELAPVREKPSVGSSIVRDQLRIRVKFTLDDPFWNWLVDKGWRPMPLQNNRRKYTVVPERIFVKLLSGDLAQREEIDLQLRNLPGVEPGNLPTAD